MVLELEHEFEEAKGVDAELIDGRVLVDGVGFAAKLFGGKLFDSSEGVHGRSKRCSWIKGLSRVERATPNLSPGCITISRNDGTKLS